MATPPQNTDPCPAPPPRPAPVPSWGPRAAPAPCCRFCGGTPALEATIRGHQGFVVVMRFLKMRGLFCRTCGIAVHREMTTKTLWQGWYGIGSFVFTPATLLLNLVSRARFGRMTPPVNGLRPPLDPGKPVVRRVGALGVLVPFLIVGALAIGAEPDDDNGNTPGVSECTNVGGTECA